MAKKAVKKKSKKKSSKPKKVRLETKERNDLSGLFIPAGLFIGMGFGFLYDALVPGLFIGLGAGFLAFALIRYVVLMVKR